MEYSKKEKRGGICFYNIDNIEFMKTKPDNYYDLAIVDPPYGIGLIKTEAGNWGIRKENKGSIDKNTNWDFEKPTKKYFAELFRVSKNQIIWGANHFIENIPNANSSCWIVWDKKNGASYFADAELAWTSFDTAVRIFQKNNMDKNKIHITQKPIYLYELLLHKYAEKGVNILDTHGGSFTNAIACDKNGFELDICEINTEYYNNGLKAFDEYKQQGVLF